MLKVGGTKINYAKFISDPPDDLAAALDRIVPRIDLAAIGNLIDETPYLSDLQREFYTVYLSARRDKLFR